MEIVLTPAERKAIAYREWYLKNKEKRSRYNTEWAKQNRPSVNQRKRRWVARNKERVVDQNSAWNRRNPEAMRAAAQRYRDANRETVRIRNRLHTQKPAVRMCRNLRKRLHEFIRQPIGTTRNIFGITPQGLCEHIQAQFSPGMSWANYGQWHVDHIRPLSSFDLTSIDQVKAASHWTNLQPLWAADNLSKHAKWSA